MKAKQRLLKKIQLCEAVPRDQFTLSMMRKKAREIVYAALKHDLPEIAAIIHPLAEPSNLTVCSSAHPEAAKVYERAGGVLLQQLTEEW